LLLDLGDELSLAKTPTRGTPLARLTPASHDARLERHAPAEDWPSYSGRNTTNRDRHRIPQEAHGK
jgi:hypothetical protein